MVSTLYISRQSCHRYIKPNLELSRIVQAGRLQQFIRNLHEVLPKQEDAERICGMWNDLRPQGVEPPQGRHHVEDGYKRYLLRNHEGNHDDGKEKSASLEFKFGKRI